MKAHVPERNYHWYCGPFALAVMSGASFAEVRAAVNRTRGRKENTGVMGMYNREMANVARRFDKELVPIRVNKKDGEPTLKKWLKEFEREEGALYLVNVTDHYVMVTDDWLLDNHTKGKVDITFAPHLRKRVKRVWRVYHY